eukprot:175322-Prymnesium_polylepis.1
MAARVRAVRVAHLPDAELVRAEGDGRLRRELLEQPARFGLERLPRLWVLRDRAERELPAHLVRVEVLLLHAGGRWRDPGGSNQGHATRELARRRRQHTSPLPSRGIVMISPVS